MTTRPEMDLLFDMVTVDAARAMGIQGHLLQPGSAANLVVLDQDDLAEALRFHSAPRAVISHGKLLN
jgi:cytosine deaminase